MISTQNPHTFHIPVMGTGFTADTAIRVAPLGISSVISLADDMLLEKLREYYCKIQNIIFEPIKPNTKNYREKRITSYLNLVDIIVKDKFRELKESLNDKHNNIMTYIRLLPDLSEIKKDFYEVLSKALSKHKYSENYINIYLNNSESYQDKLLSLNNFLDENHQIKIDSLPEVAEWVNNNLTAGAIDVNIMTRVDKVNYFMGEELPAEFNDAHLAVSGFAHSTLNSSLVLSAGMNPHLYSYIEQFEDFYPDESGLIKKKIIIKVSDYRSAIIQGKYLAKKGLWVSEFRIESGLNCGGHAFATDGHLMGPIIQEFKNSKNELVETLHEIYSKALTNKNKYVPAKPFQIKITAQGGVGTADEHNFLLEYYNLDSIGWGTPFLLVPEVTNMDDKTRELLCKAGEKELYLSNISPLGVPFNNLRDNFQDIKKNKLISEGTPGSVCSKKFLRINRDNTYGNLCPASKVFQEKKIKELNSLNISNVEYDIQYSKIVEKSCLCHGLANSAIKKGNVYPEVEGTEISVCPGPNMAYFSKIVSLAEMVSHIYGRTNVIEKKNRPNMFVKELELYVNYLYNKINSSDTSKKNSEEIDTFVNNMIKGIEYYKNLFSSEIIKKYNFPQDTFELIDNFRKQLESITIKHAAA